MKEKTPLVIDIPVEGNWITPNSPGTKVPSHGTTLFGESHAIDFVMVENGKAHKKPLIEYILLGLPLDDFYGWGQPVFNVLTGEVVEIENSVEERSPVNILGDLSYMLSVTKSFKHNPKNVSSVAGNYVLVKCSEKIYALYAHLKKGSVLVEVGKYLKPGDKIGSLGHSGNSTMPHLHFQLMDSADFRKAVGLPFRFRKYQLLEGKAWRGIENSLPKKGETIRFYKNL